ncbi:MAG: hypothetical protein MR357_04000 [Anaeroplasma sp.]|nr:hypothetical protein [Anaeroplasma sp.]
MKKYTGIFWVIGLCAVIAVLCTGAEWILNQFNGTLPLLTKIAYYAKLVLYVLPCIVGLFWILSIKNKTVRIIVLIFYIAFFILSIFGYMGKFF